mgnify:CR=1 FL=1
MDNLGESLKKVMLAGVGALATTAEKSKEILDDLVKKGELTVEQGKVLNEELKHNVKKAVKENVTVKVKPSSPEELEELLDKMTPEQIDQLKEKLAGLDKPSGEPKEEPAATPSRCGTETMPQFMEAVPSLM